MFVYGITYQVIPISSGNDVGITSAANIGAGVIHVRLAGNCTWYFKPVFYLPHLHFPDETHLLPSSSTIFTELET